jgi:hypothetical protein
MANYKTVDVTLSGTAATYLTVTVTGTVLKFAKKDLPVGPVETVNGTLTIKGTDIFGTVHELIAFPFKLMP